MVAMAYAGKILGSYALTFAGVLAAYLDEGADLRTAMAKAAVAGSLACTKHGAQPSFPTRAEIGAAGG